MAVDPKSSGKVCVVACKLPHGLKVQAYITPANAPPIVDPDFEPILLAGGNTENAIGGYGFTPGVDADRFQKWLDGNRGFPAVKQGLIFAETTFDRARDRAREQEAIANGFERINPDKPGNGVAPDKDRPKE